MIWRVLFFLALIAATSVGVFWWKRASGPELMLRAAGWGWDVRDIRLLEVGGYSGVDAYFIPLAGQIPLSLDAALLRALCGTLLLQLEQTRRAGGDLPPRSLIYRVGIKIPVQNKEGEKKDFYVRIPVREGACIAPNETSLFIYPFPPPMAEWQASEIIAEEHLAKGKDPWIAFEWTGLGRRPDPKDFPFEFACNAVLADPFPEFVAMTEKTSSKKLGLRVYYVRLGERFLTLRTWRQANFLLVGDRCVFLNETNS